MKQKITLDKQQFEDLERGCTVEILLDGVPAYVCRADFGEAHNEAIYGAK